MQISQEPQGSIIWDQRGSGIYFANFGEGKNGVCVEIVNIPTRTGGARVVVKFSSPGLGEVHVLEPIPKVFSLKKKYDTPEETELGVTMSRLLAIASQQYATREQQEVATTEERKQAIFSRLFGEI